MSRGPMRSMSRTASMSHPLIKVEPGEETTSDVVRTSILDSKFFKRRQIDLSRKVTNVAKAEREALVHAELKEAISGVKRPNRQLSGKMLADTAERRHLSRVQSKFGQRAYGKHLIFIDKRNSHKEASGRESQIAATPTCHRRKDVSITQSQIVSGGNARMEPETVLKARLLETNTSVSTSVVQATPCRDRMLPPTAQSSLQSWQKGRLDDSPSQARRSSAQLFSPLQGIVSATPPTQRVFILKETPIKKPIFLSSEHLNALTTEAAVVKEGGINKEQALTCKEASKKQFCEPENLYKMWDDLDDLVNEL